MSRVYVYNASQQPDLKSVKTLDQFSNEFLKASSDNYPKSHNNLEQLKLEKENQVKIGNKYKVEEFLSEVPTTSSTGSPVTAYHDGYIHYLLTAWMNDCGIEVGPWFIWNIVLHQLCQVVKAEPDKYRAVFTNSDEKITITFTDGQMFDINRFIGELRGHVPLDIDTFVPRFPSEPIHYAESMYGLFADMVQEYYGCMILGCSIPKVRLLGTDEDWISLMDATRKINAYFEAKGVKSEYLTKASSAIFEMITNLNNAQYWSTFFHVVRCGSGSQEEVRGHVMKLVNRSGTTLVHDLPEMISRYPFKYLPNHDGPKGEDMNFVSGVFYSSLDTEGILVPEYHCNITVTNNDRCKVTDQDAREIEVLIEFLKRMKKYSGTSSGKYVKNHLEITQVPSQFLGTYHDRHLPPVRILAIPTWEEYYKKNSEYSMGPEKDIRRELEKRYKKMTKDFEAHNDRVRRSNGNLQEYLRLINAQRHLKLKHKHAFWIQKETDLLASSEDYPKDYPDLSLATWQELLPRQDDDVTFVTTNFDIIYRYIANNHFEVFRDYLVKMYNPTIINLFLNRFRAEPFPFDWCGGGYSWTDPHVDKATNPDDLYYNLVFYLLTHSSGFGCRYLNDDLSMTLKRECLPSQSFPLYTRYQNSLLDRIRRAIRDSTREPKYYNLEKELTDYSATLDIRRYREICQLRDQRCDYIDVINGELAKAGVELRVDEKLFEEKKKSADTVLTIM